MLSLRRRVGQSIILVAEEIRINLRLVCRNGDAVLLQISAVDDSAVGDGEIAAVVRRVRKENFLLKIGKIDVTIWVVNFNDQGVLLSFDAPPEVVIYRRELTRSVAARGSNGSSS